MKAIEKIIIGGVVATSVISMNYNISNADKIGQETYITTNRLNMRKGPSTDYAIVGTLSKGAKVTAIQKSTDGKWIKISYNSQTVWVNLSYLQKEEQTTSNIKIGSKYITTANLNMRKGASTNYIKIATIPANTQITPTGVSTDGKWVKINYNNQTGWVVVDYIKLYESTNTSTQPNKVEVGKTYETTMNVYSRKGPSSDYEVITVLNKGTTIKPLEIVKAGYWAKFEYNGQYAYVCTTYLQGVKETTDTTLQKISGTYEVTANLNLREGPATSYARRLIIPYGAKVTASQITSDKQWTKITYNGQNGWVKSEYIKKIDSETPAPTKTTYYTTANVNFRSGASTTSNKIGLINANEKVIVTDFNSDHSWAKVTYNSKTGWVSAQYLTNKEPKNQQKEQTYWNGTTTANLNMRKGPNTSYSIIVTVPKNSTVKIYDQQSGWAKIKYKSYEGYCSAQYIK